MADFVFKVSPNIVLGSYTVARLGQILQTWGTRFMLVADPILKDEGILEKIEKTLTDKNIEYFIFDEIPTAATTETLGQVLELARGARVHGILSAGGMKSANLGRAAAALYNETNDIFDFVDGAQPYTAPLPFIELCTTIRDPFMFADKTPVIDARNRNVKLLKMQNGVCKVVVIDSNLFLNLTKNQLNSMLLQSLCFAVEGYLSSKATFFSDTILEKALQLLHYAMDGAGPLAVQEPPELLAAQAGCMASLGVSLSAPGAAAMLSLAANARFKAQQALVSSILLPYVLEDAARSKGDRLALIARTMGLAGGAVSVENASEMLVENTRSRLAMADIPARLKDLGLSIEELATVAEDAGRLEYMNFLPRSMTTDDLFDLVKQAF